MFGLWLRWFFALTVVPRTKTMHWNVQTVEPHCIHRVPPALDDHPVHPDGKKTCALELDVEHRHGESFSVSSSSLRASYPYWRMSIGGLPGTGSGP